MWVCFLVAVVIVFTCALVFTQTLQFNFLRMNKEKQTKKKKNRKRVQ